MEKNKLCVFSWPMKYSHVIINENTAHSGYHKAWQSLNTAWRARIVSEDRKERDFLHDSVSPVQSFYHWRRTPTQDGVET